MNEVDAASHFALSAVLLSERFERNARQQQKANP